MSREALAARSGLAVDTIARLEKDAFSPSYRTLFKLSAGLEISVSTFFDGLCRGTLDTHREALDLVLAMSPPKRRASLAVLRALAHVLEHAPEATGFAACETAGTCEASDA